VFSFILKIFNIKMSNKIDSNRKDRLMKVEKYVSIGASDSVGIGTSNPSKDG
jgi:hypothetical protein